MSVRNCGDGRAPGANWFPANILVTLSDAAMLRLKASGGHSENVFGLEQIDEILRRWGVRHISAPFGVAATYEDPEIRRLARTFVVALGRATDLEHLQAELLQLDLVEEVHDSDPRFPLLERAPDPPVYEISAPA